MSESCSSVDLYARRVPRLWSESVETHRRAVRDATLDAAAVLVSEHGLAAVTMSEIAKGTGIGRATLYKYFPDVESILLAWHSREVAGHVAHLAVVRDRAGDPSRRLDAVLGAYAHLSQRHRGTALAAALHRSEDVTRAQHQLVVLLSDLLAEGAHAGWFRNDVAPEELAAYCLHALSAASDLPSEEAVRRLVAVTLDGLRPR